MEPRALTQDEVRNFVAVYAPETLDTFDRMTSNALPALYGNPPIVWTDKMRIEVALQLWNRYDATRAN
jgi:hypothetical protein